MVTARKSLGDFGERVAAHKLESLGMTILARNVRVPSGEIDLVAADAADVVFVEVRTRRHGAGFAAESITPVKFARMWQCAMDYCEQTSLDIARARLDLVTVDLGPDGGAAEVEHLRGLSAG